MSAGAAARAGRPQKTAAVRPRRAAISESVPPRSSGRP